MPRTLHMDKFPLSDFDPWNFDTPLTLILQWGLMGNARNMRMVMDAFAFEDKMTVGQYIKSRNRLNANQWIHNKFELEEQLMSQEDMTATEYMLKHPNDYMLECMDQSPNLFIDKNDPSHPAMWSPDTPFRKVLQWGLHGLRPEATKLMYVFKIPRGMSQRLYETEKITEKQWNDKKMFVGEVRIPEAFLETAKYIMLNPEQYANDISLEATKHVYPWKFGRGAP